MFVFLLTFLIIIITTYCLYKYQIQWKHIDKLPGPRTLPLIGNALQLGLNPVDYFKNLLKYWRIYDKKIYRIWIGQEPFVVISDPKDVEVVLSSNTLLKKSNIYKFIYPWIGHGLLTSDGNKWFKHRKIITPSFHFQILVHFHEVIKDKSKKFVQNLASKAETKKIFDIQERVHYTTLDVICETAMGTEINALENNNSAVVTAFQDLCYVVQRQILSPLMHNSTLFKFFKEYTMQKEALDVLQTFTLDVISKRRKFILEEKEKEISSEKNLDSSDSFQKKKQVFLDTLLTSTIDGKPLMYEEIYEEVQTFMFAGHDTTTSGITFAIYLLSRHPAVQEKVYEEQQLLFGNDLQNVEQSFQDVQNMNYLDMVIKECQRMYPSVPMIGRNTTTNFEINGKLIPKNSTIMLLIFAMGYNENYFPDPYKFDPERFNSDKVKQNPFEYVPFSAGPRNCVGQKFAVLEMKSIVAHVVRNYKILPPDDECLKVNGDYENLGKFKYDPVLATVLTLKAEYGVQIRLEKRDKN